MNPAETFLQKQLALREEKGIWRKLSLPKVLIDFCSNDYLGFAGSKQLQALIDTQFHELDGVKNGATGSRLLSGNAAYTEDTEDFIAAYHRAEAGLIFNSGYDANMGLLSSIPQRGDTIITDELIHASLIDGARLSHADRIKFKHNDIEDLERKLKLAKGMIYVVVESVYSMDGDLAPLVAISLLCKKFSANLIVDEAHATGIFGTKGSGLVCHLDLEDQVFARIVTFGKALGIHGSIVLGSRTLRDYLINYARSFIYTTAAPIHQIVAVNCAYQLLAADTAREDLHRKIDFYGRLISSSALPDTPTTSAIQTVRYSDNATTKQAAAALREAGFDVRPILSPTVPVGKERLRICLHTYNSEQEIEQLVLHLKHYYNHGQ